MPAETTRCPVALGFRRAGERGDANHGWLHSRHTFSFADYHDPSWMGFRNLRVINDDRVDAGQGFPPHPHRDMEIVSYVLEGALEHKDSMGTGSVIRPGDVQRMSAGTGVRHSEYNGSKSEPVHFLQIWMLPREPGIAPGYEQKTFSVADKQGKLRLVASPDGREGSITVHADASIHAGLFGHGERASFELKPGRHAWVHVAKGSIVVNGERLVAGDAAYTRNGDGGTLNVEGDESGEVLVFDLA
jgi:quercetin 2,3-dioxygenase